MIDNEFGVRVLRYVAADLAGVDPGLVHAPELTVTKWGGGGAVLCARFDDAPEGDWLRIGGGRFLLRFEDLGTIVPLIAGWSRKLVARDEAET